MITLIPLFFRMRYLLRPLILGVFALLGSVSHGQFAFWNAEQLSAERLAPMRLVVPVWKGTEVSPLLDSLLHRYWKLTPIVFVDHDKVDGMRTDADVLLLERLIIEEKKGGVLIRRTRSGPVYGPTEKWVAVQRAVPFTDHWGICNDRIHHNYWQKVLNERQVLAVTWTAGAAIGHQCGSEKIEQLNLVTASTYDDRNVDPSDPMYGVRMEWMIKRLVQGLTEMSAMPMVNDINHAWAEQIEATKTRFAGLKGKKLILPVGWLSQQEMTKVLKEFGDDAVEMFPAQVKKVINEGDDQYVLLVVLNGAVEFVDVATGDILYYRETTAQPMIGQLISAHQRWKFLK